MNTNTRIKIFYGNITELKIEAIVNAANSWLLGGGGVDGAIHRAAGPGLLEECEALPTIDDECRRCPTGEARLTKGYNLPARYVIHTVGPVYSRFQDAECARLLRACYRNSLSLAHRTGIRSIAFPGISTGIYGYPSDKAANIAYQAVKDYIAAYPDALDEVIFVAFSDEAEALYRKLAG